MRVQKLTGADAEKQQQFADWLLSVGEGNNYINNDSDIQLPKEIIHNSKSIDEFVSTVFEDISTRCNDNDYVIKRAILTSKMSMLML